MNYLWHKRIGFLFLLISDMYLISNNYSLQILAIWSAFFYLFTVVITPDLDTNSTPRKKLGVIGWIIDKLFKHRGALHSYILWAVLFIPIYYFVGWACLGGLIAVYLHLVVDGVSTKVKKVLQ